MILKTISSFFLLIFFTLTKAQDIKWIPFKWTSETISGKYFDKSSMVIPVKLDNIQANFNMQFDLGAVRTVIYGNSIQPYLDIYPDLKNKIDNSKTFLIQGENHPMFTNIELKAGSTSFSDLEIGYYKNFGTKISQESILSDTEKHIGTIGQDLFQNKILIIDYQKNRIGICEEMPQQYKSATFQPFKSNDGRPKIPLTTPPISGIR